MFKFSRRINPLKLGVLMFGVNFGLRKYRKYLLLQTNHFTFSYCNIPHPEKVHKGGEDAYFGS